MQQENDFVMPSSTPVSITPAQQNLLTLLSHPNAQDFAAYLQTVQRLATFFVKDTELVDLTASLHVLYLQDALQELAKEHEIKTRLNKARADLDV